MGVPLADVLANNTSLGAANPSGPIAVFVGATAGIGLGALQALTKYTNASTIYIVGRSPLKLEALIGDLKQLNAKATFIPIHASDLTKIHDAQSAAREIAEKVGAGQVDLLVMSPGYITFKGREEHPEEGVDKCTAVRHYSRMAFVLGLKDALQRAPGPRIVSVLAGGKEGALWKEDMLLREKGRYGVSVAGGAAASMHSLFFEEVAKRPGWEKAVFIHNFPGAVSTGLEVSGLGMIGDFLLNWLARPIIYWVGYTQEEAGERVLFAATSGRFRRVEGVIGEGSLIMKGSDGVVGSGVYIVQADTMAVQPTKEMVKLRGEGMGEVVYQHTVKVLQKIEKGERA
jgi:NAD(P)-dependent dehydrogenase (short-subunit alcohol dehydrogenase family)